jgi:F0F1-type ATP synthase assembly protein I
MKVTVRRLFIVHLAVLALASLGSALVWGLSGVAMTVTGALCFSLPVVAFSLLVLRASEGNQTQFWGRFMVAEALKWVTAAGLLTLAFLSGAFKAQPLLAGFFLSVLVQVFFPMFVPKKESES